MNGDPSPHLERQRRFYQSRGHQHLQAHVDDYYSAKLVETLVRECGIDPEHRVLEVGAGFGRFTLHLLRHCREVVAVDLSARALETLEESCRAAGIPDDRCLTVEADIDDPNVEALKGPFDFVVGFYVLHHLADYAATLCHLAPKLVPGGRTAFIEPNRRNPLFLAQVAFCADMDWKEEKGMFQLSAAGVERAFAGAGLRSRPTHRFGFFPPPVLQHWPPSRAIENRLEHLPGLGWLLPLLLVSAEAPS